MRTDAGCPVCGAAAWESLGLRRFERGARSPSPYVAARLDVLFELWAPGEGAVELRFVLCARCGFVTYLPRATDAELDAKYRYLADRDPVPPRAAVVTSLDDRRSRELFALAAPFLGAAPGGDLLDVGGGVGALTTAFTSRGFRASVVDYVPEAVPGVSRLGATLAEVPPDRRFDVVVCSHVLEHLADPLATVTAIRSRLRDGGLLVCAVPLEIEGGPPAIDEPVTHVNFFCRASLGALLARAGLVPLRVSEGRKLAASGAVRPAVIAVARRDDGEPAPEFELRPGEARRLLRPGLAGRAARALARLGGAG